MFGPQTVFHHRAAVLAESASDHSSSRTAPAPARDRRACVSTPWVPLARFALTGAPSASRAATAAARPPRAAMRAARRRQVTGGDADRIVGAQVVDRACPAETSPPCTPPAASAGPRTAAPQADRNRAGHRRAAGSLRSSASRPKLDGVAGRPSGRPGV